MKMLILERVQAVPTYGYTMCAKHGHIHTSYEIAMIESAVRNPYDCGALSEKRTKDKCPWLSQIQMWLGAKCR